MAMNPSTVRDVMNRLREHMNALEQLERPEVLRDLVDRVKDIENRMNEVLPRVQQLTNVADRLRQIHEDMATLQNALAA